MEQPEIAKVVIREDHRQDYNKTNVTSPELGLKNVYGVVSTSGEDDRMIHMHFSHNDGSDLNKPKIDTLAQSYQQSQASYRNTKNGFPKFEVDMNSRANNNLGNFGNTLPNNNLDIMARITEMPNRESLMTMDDNEGMKISKSKGSTTRNNSRTLEHMASKRKPAENSIT